MAINFRQEVAAVYSHSPNWAVKVQRMSDTQVYAIFQRFRKEGKIKL
jgi:hypothetical protein